MVTAESDKLLANRTATVSLALAVLRVRHDALHLLTRRQTTICIATLTGVNERLDAALYRLLASFLRIGLGSTVGRRGSVVKIEPKPLHLMVMADLFFTWKTQIEILKR
jgi:hypothetical protein